MVLPEMNNMNCVVEEQGEQQVKAHGNQYD
jgi:hypothetical protein